MKIKAYLRLFYKGRELSYRGYRPTKMSLSLTSNYLLENTSRIQFPRCNENGITVDYLVVGDKFGKILYEGKLDDVINIPVTAIPQFSEGGLRVDTSKGKWWKKKK